MTSLGNARQRTPDWQVTAVFDPEGGGRDFAYSVGLTDRGLPELHLWARPSLGDDPGADWKLSRGTASASSMTSRGGSSTAR